jgi:hypothetical protein
MTDKLETELAALRAEVEELKRAANPPAPPKFEAGPRGPTTTELAMSRASLSREAMRAMVEAVPDSEVAGILRDGRATQNLLLGLLDVGTQAGREGGVLPEVLKVPEVQLKYARLW